MRLEAVDAPRARGLSFARKTQDAEIASGWWALTHNQRCAGQRNRQRPAKEAPEGGITLPFSWLVGLMRSRKWEAEPALPVDRPHKTRSSQAGMGGRAGGPPLTGQGCVTSDRAGCHVVLPGPPHDRHLRTDPYFVPHHTAPHRTTPYCTLPGRIGTILHPSVPVSRLSLSGVSRPLRTCKSANLRPVTCNSQPATAVSAW